jgi:ElaB/YqjD/DUF883 family membrane-anchored ribosome-binding protein
MKGQQAMNTPEKFPTDTAAQVARTAAQGAADVASTTRRAVGNGVDEVSASMDHARQETGAALRQLVSDSEALAHRGMEKVRDSADQLREKSLHARDVTSNYIQHEPMKSVLIAAAAGAALMALVALFSRHGHSGR